MKVKQLLSYKKYLAFSLIELSMVLIIIGLIISGIISSQKLIQLSRLTSARTLTNSSPVNNIEDLAMWLEATSKSSFDGSKRVDGASIDIWYDINPQSTYKHDSTQTTADNQPVYSENGINKLPAVTFDGTNDYLKYSDNNQFMVGTDYSVTIVEQRGDNNGSYFIGGSDGTTNGRLAFGYENSTSLRHAQQANFYQIDNIVSAFSSPMPRIHTITHSTVNPYISWI